MRELIYLICLLLNSYLLGDPDAVVKVQVRPEVETQMNVTKQEVAPNAVPVVDITQPNAAGVSHNYYEKFNVNREGLILNNSTVAAQSQLGGLLMGNANLARTGSASLIVNEVTGATQSHIRGFIEVHGRAADLVIANPNGISVNGGGFINAPRVTLTTGLPEFDANGALQSLLVQQGKVSIGERGMYVQNCNYCDILANAVEINGTIQGQRSIDQGTEMRVISGYYRFDYPTRTATEEGGGDPIMGVDSSALGGMYAGKIYFIAKGRDVGVKLPPNMATNTGDLVVEADGSIHLSGQLNSSGKIEIKTLNELVSQDMKIRTNDKINLSARSVTMGSTDSFTPKKLSLKAIDAITSSNTKLRSVQALKIQGGSLESTGDQLVSLADISLKSTTGAMTLKKAVFNSPEKISIQSEGNVALNGKLAAKQGIQLISQGGLQQTGILEASEGSIVTQTNGDSSVKGKWTARDGIQIASDRSIAIENHSLLSSASPIVVKSGNLAHLEGTIRSKESITINAATLGLKPQTELSGKSLSLSQRSEEAIQWNAITLNGEEKVSVKTPGDINFFGSVLSSGEVMLESEKSMDFRGTESKIEGKITLKAKNRLSVSGFLLALSSVFLTADELSVRPQTQIESAADVLIDAKNPLAIPADSSVLAKELAIKSPSLTNKGLLQGSNSVDLNADRQLTNEGQILSEGNLTIETAQLQNNGILQAALGNFTIADVSNIGGIWIAGPWTFLGDKAVNTGWLRVDGPWTGKFNTFENLDGWLKGTSVDFKDPMRWLNKARMSFSGDVLLPQSTFENVSADFYSGGNVTLDTLRNVNEKEPKLKTIKEPPYAVKWTSKGWNEEESPTVTIFWDQKLPVSYCHDGDPHCGKGIMDWHRGYNHMPKVEETKVVFEQEPGISSSFQIIKNLFVQNRIDNFYSRLQVGGNLSINKILQNKGAQSFLKKQVSGWKYVCQDGNDRPWYAFRPFKNQPAPEILATAPSTIQVGGKIEGTVKSFMNGEAVAKDDTIKDNLGALPAYAEPAWDKEKAALKVLREGGKDPIEKLRFAAPEVDLKPEVPALGGMAMAALPPVEVVRVEEDERTQLWRLQVQDFLDEVRAEPLVFNAKYDAPYVIETNPMYVDPGLFYGSQYFLDRVDLTSGGKPSIETRLGDAFFENQLIRQQIQAATNRFILSHQYANEAEQQLALYNNALEEARELGLKAGERLTPEQVKKLKRDLIWLETEEVDGKHVLVPRVYLCANTKSSLYTSASQVFAKSIDLQVEGDVLNQGLIEAEEDLSIQAGGTIANVAGKFSTQEGDLSLQAEGNVLNISGEIASGNDLNISGKTIALTTTKQRMDGYKSHTDVLGATAKISAKNALHLAAEEHLAAIGTSFKGNDVTLVSGGDMHLDAAEKTYHYRDGGGNWQINEHGAHALQTTIEANKNVHLWAQDDLKTRAVKVQAGGDFEVKSEQGAVTSEAFKDYDYAYYYSHHSGGLLGGSSTTETTSYVAHDIGSDIVAQETGTLSAEKDVHLKAGKVAAKDLTLESKSGKVKLEAGKDEDFYRHYHKSSGLITTSVDDEGHDRNVSKPVEILAQTVTVPSPAEIDYKAGLGKEFREALAGRTDIDWKAVQDHYREWSEHTTTLSGPARMLVACVLSVVTQGMGTSQWLAGHGIAEGTATNAALSSGIQTLAASAGTALAANLGDFSKAFDELTSTAALKNLTASILSAGLQLDTAASLPEATLKSAESLAIQTGLQNRKLSDILISDVVDAGAAQVAHGIGSAHATGTLGELGHKAAHGTLAVTSAKLTGRDPVGAAVGAVVGEIAAESLYEDGKDPAKTAAQARIIGDTAAFVAGRDVDSADAAAQNAIENNWWWTLDAYHYGKIYAESGKEGIIEEIKEHPVEAALAAGGLGWVGRVGKGAKAIGKLAKAEKLEQKAVQTTKTISEAKPILGGSYGKVTQANKGLGKEAHHIPADSVSGIPRDKGPVILMEKADHKKTGSHPKLGNEAKFYRAEQKTLIEQGNYRGALSKDFWDIHGKFGTKYNEGFKQAIEYAKTLPEFQKGMK